MIETVDRIKEAGLKLTPQRKVVYEAMIELRHASMEEIIARVAEKDSGITVSTVYRILDSFCKANLLSLICHPETGKCYYDITVEEHHHMFSDGGIVDYNDPELTEVIRKYLHEKRKDPRYKNLASADINRIQVQITVRDDDKKHALEKKGN